MRIEYFLRELNGWLCLNIEDVVNLFFRQEEGKIQKIKSINVPIKIIFEDEFSNPEKLISGNYVEVVIEKKLSLTANIPNKLNISIENNEDNEKIYKIWVIAKIISYDFHQNILLLDYEEELIAIDDMNKIRPLSEIKKLEEEISIYYIRKITNSEYSKFESEFEKFKKEMEEERQYLLYHYYDNIKSSVFFFGPKKDIKNFLSLMELENKYKMINNEDTNANSAITSRSEESEKNEIRSLKSKNSNILIDEEEILNEINECEFKQTYTYKTLFKKDVEEILEKLIKKNKYFLSCLNSEEFKIIIYGKSETEFENEKKKFEHGYKAVELKGDYENGNEMKEIATNAKVKLYFGKNYIYLIGEEKNISNFKEVLNLKAMYSDEIQKKFEEKESIQKQLINIKNEYKIN